MLFATHSPTLRLWLGAAVALLACQSGLFAQIGKVNCQDQPCCPGWPQFKLIDCLPCKQKACPPLNQYYGYHPNTWRLWPGTKPNGGYIEAPKRDLLLNQPTELPASPEKKSSPGGAAMPAKQPETHTRVPAAHFPTLLATLPALAEEGISPGKEVRPTLGPPE